MSDHDDEFVKASQRWRAYFDNRHVLVPGELPPVPPKPQGPPEPKPMEQQSGALIWIRAQERIPQSQSWKLSAYPLGVQTAWGNPKAAQKAAKRFARRMKMASYRRIEIRHAAPYKYEGWVLK